MISYIGIGSNLGNRRALIKQSLEEIRKLKNLKILKTSYTYENPALTNEDSKFDWDKTFLNAAIKIETKDTSPEALLLKLQAIEKKAGRQKNKNWQARPIDLDILHIENKKINSQNLTVPHKEFGKRNFVTAPLRDLSPSTTLNSKDFLSINRDQKNPLPIWMGIANITPDSFSDGGLLFEKEKPLFDKIERWAQAGVHIIDLGAESTRPGAHSLDSKEEIRRLLKPLQIYKKMTQLEGLPFLSLDSRNYKTIEFALNYNLKIINDVSGLKDKNILSLLKDSDCDYVLMHSLSIPADPNIVVAKNNSINQSICTWLEEKIEVLEKENISLDRVIFDPGIGFGKTASQSMEILRSLKDYKKYGLRLLAGHSRKSFIKNFSSDNAKLRDHESIGLSLALADQGVDLLRVHKPENHIKAHLGYLYAHSSLSN